MSSQGKKGAGTGFIQSQLTVVDEHTSECGFKEDLDRKEFHYKDEIDALKTQIEDKKSINELTLKDIDNIHR